MGILQKLSDPEWWIDKACSDLYFLCRNMLITLEDMTPGFKDLYYPTHKHVADFVQKYGQEHQKLLILMPRAWLKSYIITTGWTIQRVLKNLRSGKREHFMISNATLSNAQNFLGRIQHNFQYNDTLRKLFSDFIPEDIVNKAERWTMDELSLSGNLIETASVEGDLVSRHYKIMESDDLVNWGNTRTPDQIMKTIDWWKLARSLATSDSIEIIIGTRWHHDDLYGHFIDKFIDPPKNYAFNQPWVELHNDNYHLLQYSCYERPAEKKGSTFPVLYPESKLHQLENEQGDGFGGQYLNDPLEMSNAIFKRSWIKTYREEQLPDVRYTIMCADPSGKANETSDASGLVVVDAGVDRNVYIRYAKRKLVTDMACLEWIIEQAMIYQPSIIGIEDTKFGSMIEVLDVCIDRMRKDGKFKPEDREYLKILPSLFAELKPHGRPKYQRIRALAPKLEGGTWYFPVIGTEELQEELLRQPASLTDDIADALAYTQDLLYFPAKTDPAKTLILPEVMKMTQEERERAEWERYRVEAGQIIDWSEVDSSLLEAFGYGQ